jgi:signal transduction histidine kinase
MGISGQLGALAAGWAVYGLETNPAVPGGQWGLWINLWIGVLTFMPMFPLLLFPDGRLHDRKTRIVAALTLLSTGWLFFSLLVGTTVPPGFPEVYSRTPNPLFPGDPIGDAGLGIMALGICGLLSAGLLLRRFREARGTLRQQYMWVIIVMCLLVLSFVGDFLGRVFTDWAFYITTPAMNISFALIPVAVGIAILRHRLFDIELIFSRALIYGLLTVCVVAIYILVVGWLGTLFRTSQNLAFSLLAAGVVAVLFQPLREQIQRRVNRVLFGDRDDPYAVLSRLGQRLENTLAVDEILPAIAATVREALKIPYAAIHVSRGLSPMLVVESGTPATNPLHLPLTFHHEHVGEILLAPRSPGEGFGPADQRLLDDLARQTGVAVNAVRLTHDLQYARERLVEAREEERRRLHRDLHDGLGSQLAALNLQFGALPTLIDSDPAAAHAEIIELRTQLRTAITSIRALVQGLRPPAIDELGLIVSLRERVRQFSTDRFVVRVDLPTHLPVLPAAIEVAIYRVTEEALANVTKHSRANRCFVRLTIERSMLKLHIEDNGIGIDARSNAGVGLRSMRERAEELGGTFEIASRAGGGTIVTAGFAFSRAEDAHD